MTMCKRRVKHCFGGNVRLLGSDRDVGRIAAPDGNCLEASPGIEPGCKDCSPLRSHSATRPTMKPGSIASAAIPRIQSGSQAVPLITRLALSVPPKGNDVAAAARENKPRSRSGPQPTQTWGARFSTIAVAAKANHAHVIAMVRLRNRKNPQRMDEDHRREHERSRAKQDKRAHYPGGRRTNR